jgi:hypothetical protein
VGYSIAIRARNPKLRKKMVKFMAKNFRNWSDVLGEGDSISSRPGLGVEGTLDYDRAKDAVGFDYASHCHGWESCLIYSATRWMAIKIGKTKSRFQKDAVTPNIFDKPVPFMVYDGYQAWPIIVVRDLKEAMRLPKTARWCATDKLGVYIGPEVNRILTTYAERVFFDKKLSEAMGRETGKLLKNRPTGGKEYDEWRERYEAVKVKFMKPEIDEMLPLVRKEIARLDALWEASTS